MSEQHPLTDEMIEQIAQFEPDLTDPLRLNRDNDMRAAYDLALNHIKALVEDKLSTLCLTHHYTDDFIELFLDEALEELRSQQQEDNS